MDYEEVKFLIINGLTIEIGDKLACSCKYEVIRLYPVWHIETKQHLPEHPNNHFMYQQIIDVNCPVHNLRK